MSQPTLLPPGKKLFAVSILFAVSLCTTAFAAEIDKSLQQKLATATATDQIAVVVTFTGTNVTPAQTSGLKSLGVISGVVFDALPIAGVLATPAQISAIAARPDVRSVYFNKQLQYFNNGATALTGVQRLRNDQTMTARNKGLPFSGRGVTVMINDSGIDGLHADLAYPSHVKQNVLGITNLNAYSDLGPVTYTEGVPNSDTGGHGTHVAGTVGGNGARSNGKYAGVAPGADLIGYGSGATLFVLDVLGGLNYAISHQAQYGIRVVNNSWGTSDPTFSVNDPVNVATYRMYEHNLINVFAAGNAGSGEDTMNPYCKAAWVICVANSQKNGILDDSSSRGVRGDSQLVTTDDGKQWTIENRPTISGPGARIISTRASTNNNSYLSSEGPTSDLELIEPEYQAFYVVLSGTSMASPHVAGIVALVLEANPALSVLQVKDLLQKTASNMSGYESWEAGAGMVNAYAAVDLASRAGAAYGSTVNASRTFHSNVKLSAVKNNWTIDFNPVKELSPTQNSFPFTVAAGVTQLDAKCSTGGVEGQTGNPVNLVLIAPDGTEYSSGITTLFAIDYGRGVSISNPIAGPWRVELRGLRGNTANPTNGTAVPETISGYVKASTSLGYSGLDDIALGDPALAYIQMAVAERLIDGFSDKKFYPTQALTRINLADYLLMGTSIRQFLPTNGSVTFGDVGSPSRLLAESATTRGAALRDMFHDYRGVILPKSAGVFAPNDPVRRVDLAYAFVQSLGLETQALNANGQQLTVDYNGQRIPIEDAAQIPAGMSGYVQVALDLNIMQAYFTLTQGPYDLQPTVHATFKPLNSVTRAAYAFHATRFYNSFFAP